MTATAEPKRLTTDLPETDFLSEQQREFVQEYLRTGSASKAGARVGFKYPSVYGPRLLKNVAVREAVNEALKAKQIDEVQVLSELSELAYANMADFMDEYGAIDPVAVRKNGHLVKKYKVTERQSEDGSQIIKTEIELHDRHAALVDVGKKYRMFGADTVNVQINVFAELNRELAPLLNECLDPTKLAKFAQGLSEIARKYGHEPQGLSVNPVLPPMAEVQTNPATAFIEPQKQPSGNGNGTNGHSHENGDT